MRTEKEAVDQNGLTEAEFLEAYQPGDYPHPSVTTDVLIFSGSPKQLELLLIQRGNHPFLHCWALPGGFSNPGESLAACAARELEEETHVTGLPLIPFGCFSDPGRDPRGWTMTEAYYTLAQKEALYVQADDDAAAAAWFQVNLNQVGHQLTLTLTHGAEELSAVLELQETCTSFGTQSMLNLLHTEGLAFDHGKIITAGYRALLKHTK